MSGQNPKEIDINIDDFEFSFPKYDIKPLLSLLPDNPPFFNEGNFKIFVENIYKRTVELVGTDFPILIKMNADDLIKGGLVLSESKKIAEKFSKLGFAAIEISSGMWEAALLSQEELGWEPAMIPESRINILSKDREAYHLSYAREIKKLIAIPLILIGGIRSLDVVEEILAEGSADFVSLSRPLIREPDLPNKWLTGSGENTCECISCNGCVASITMDRVHCTQKEK